MLYCYMFPHFLATGIVFSSCPEHPPTKVGYRADMCQLRVFNKPTLGAAVWQEGHWAADCPAQGSGGQYGGQGAGQRVPERRRRRLQSSWDLRKTLG